MDLNDDIIHFVVHGAPQPAGSKRPGMSKKTGKMFVRDANPKSAEWKRWVAQAAGEAMAGRPVVDGPLACWVTFYRVRPKGHYKPNGELSAVGKRTRAPDTRPDTTKLMRGVEDAMTGVVYRDDAQLVSQVVQKSWGPTECVDIAVWPAPEV